MRIPLFKIELGPLIIEAIKKSKTLDEEMKKAAISRWILRGEKFLVDPKGREVLIPPKNEKEK